MLSPLVLTHLGRHILAAALFLGGCYIEDFGIPQVLGKLTNLEALDVSFTLFHGPMHGDEVFSNLQKLRYLEMGGNAYNTSVPESIYTLPKLERLYVEFSFLTGDLSFLEEMVNAYEIWLDLNSISGSIPDSLPTTLASLSLTENEIHGTIPASIGQLTEMQQLWLYGNALMGNLPTELGGLQKLATLQVEGNSLSGEMPASVCENLNLWGGSLSTLVCDCEVECSCCSCCGYNCLEETVES